MPTTADNALLKFVDAEISQGHKQIQVVASLFNAASSTAIATAMQHCKQGGADMTVVHDRIQYKSYLSKSPQLKPVTH